jgi:hypothetical protein
VGESLVRIFGEEFTEIKRLDFRLCHQPSGRRISFVVFRYKAAILVYFCISYSIFKKKLSIGFPVYFI